jgi:hypothetical protein
MSILNAKARAQEDILEAAEAVVVQAVVAVVEVQPIEVPA